MKPYERGSSVDCFPAVETCSVHEVPFQYRNSYLLDGSLYQLAGTSALGVRDHSADFSVLDGVVIEDALGAGETCP